MAKDFRTTSQKVEETTVQTVSNIYKYQVAHKLVVEHGQILAIKRGNTSALPQAVPYNPLTNDRRLVLLASGKFANGHCLIFGGLSFEQMLSGERRQSIACARHILKLPIALVA